MKENLTHTPAVRYSINRMVDPGQTEQAPRGGIAKMPVSREPAPLSQSANPRGTEAARLVGTNPNKNEIITVDGIQAQRILADLKREQIIENTRLDSGDRVKKATEILGRNLSKSEESAVLAAHNIGAGEKGKKGEAGVFNYTQKQIAQKTRVLKEAGFSSGERRSLLENGIAGLPPDAFNVINVGAYTDDDVVAAATFVVGAGGERNVDSAVLQNQISELNAKINSGGPGPGVVEARALRGQLQDLARQAFTQESGERQRAEAQLRGRRRDGVDNLPPEATVQDIKDAIERDANDPAGSTIPDALMEDALRYKETREMLINRILFKPFETESGRYDTNSNLYAQGNWARLLNFLRVHEMRQDPNDPNSPVDVEATQELRDRYDEYNLLGEAAPLFYEMNVAVVSGQMRELLTYSQKISNTHFEAMKTLPGVADAMRLYEEKYQEILATRGRILSDTQAELVEKVENSFNSLNEFGIVRSEYEAGRQGPNAHIMEQWEKDRALDVARAFFNISFRAAEHIANGQLEEGGKKWRGFPQEHAVRLVSWLKWMPERFEIAPTRGGLDYLDRTKRNWQEWQREKKRKIDVNQIRELGGMNVDDMELGGAFGVSGIYSSWRLETMLVDKLKIDVEGREMTIQEWLDEKVPLDGRHVFKGDKDIHQHTHWHDTGETEQKRSAWISQIRGLDKSQEALVEILKPLFENNSTALGYFVKSGLFAGDVGYLARQRLWEKVADSNVPLMLNYLSSIKLEGQAKRTHIDLIPAVWDQYTTVGPDGKPENARWDEFKNKVMADHTWKIKNAGNVAPGVNPVNFDATEQALIVRIKDEGRVLAPHLADILFPYVPFMNDIPFDLIDYTGPGNTFYVRRIGSDLGAFSGAEEAYVKILGNPGGIGAEKALENFLAIEQGIEGPNGQDDAQDKVFPMFSAWAEFVMTRPGQRQAVVNALTHLVRKPTSLAQEYSGLHAESLNEAEMLEILGHAEKMGVLSHELYDEMKKKKRLGLLSMVWAVFRDIAPFVPAIAIGQTAKETTKQ